MFSQTLTRIESFASFGKKLVMGVIWVLSGNLLLISLLTSLQVFA